MGIIQWVLARGSASQEKVVSEDHALTEMLGVSSPS